MMERMDGRVHGEPGGSALASGPGYSIPSVAFLKLTQFFSTPAFPMHFRHQMTHAEEQGLMSCI